MAKQKPFFVKIIQRAKADEGFRWDADYLDWFRNMRDGLEFDMVCPYSELWSPKLMTLQQESYLRLLDEDRIEVEGGNEDEPYLYAGLGLAWDEMPLTLEFNQRVAAQIKDAYHPDQTEGGHPALVKDFLKAAAGNTIEVDGMLYTFADDAAEEPAEDAEEALDAEGASSDAEGAPDETSDEGAFDIPLDLNAVPLSALSQYFPNCMLIDTRSLDFSLYEVPMEALFVYPSYDMDRGYVMLLLVGTCQRHGLQFALQSKLVLQGDTFADAVANTLAERATLSQMWWEDFNENSFGQAFSPLDDDREVMELAAHILAAICADGVELRQANRSLAPHVQVLLPKPEPAPVVEAVQPKLPAGGEAGADAAGQGAEGQQEEEAEARPLTLEELQDLVASQEQTLAALRKTLSDSVSRQAAMKYNLEQAQAAGAQAQAKADAYQARAQLFDQLELPDTPLEALELASRVYGDRLIVLDSARKSAEEFKKGDPGEVWAVLRSIAVVLHPLIFQGMSTHITTAFYAESGYELALRDSKLTNRNSDLKSQRMFEYHGKLRDATPHVKGRGSKRGETLRVHFFTDHDEQRIVIAHCGEHLETINTSKI